MQAPALPSPTCQKRGFLARNLAISTAARSSMASIRLSSTGSSERRAESFKPAPKLCNVAESIRPRLSSRISASSRPKRALAWLWRRSRRACLSASPAIAATSPAPATERAAVLACGAWGASIAGSSNRPCGGRAALAAPAARFATKREGSIFITTFASAMPHLCTRMVNRA